MCTAVQYTFEQYTVEILAFCSEKVVFHGDISFFIFHSGHIGRRADACSFLSMDSVKLFHLNESYLQGGYDKTPPPFSGSLFRLSRQAQWRYRIEATTRHSKALCFLFRMPGCGAQSDNATELGETIERDCQRWSTRASSS